MQASLKEFSWNINPQGPVSPAPSLVTSTGLPIHRQEEKIQHYIFYFDFYIFHSFIPSQVTAGKTWCKGYFLPINAHVIYECSLFIMLDACVKQLPIFESWCCSGMKYMYINTNTNRKYFLSTPLQKVKL